MELLRVRYNPIFAWIFLPCAIFVGGTGLVLGKPMLMVLGAMQTFIGYQYATGTWYVVEERQIGVKNLLGMTLKTHAFGSLAELEVEGGKVVHAPRGGGRTVLKGVGKSVAHPRDWAELVARIEAARRPG